MNKFYDNLYKKCKTQRVIVNDKNYTYRYLLRVIKPLLKNVTEVLDIGCGVGTVDFHTALKCKSVIGIDYSSNAINIAKINAEKFNLSDNTKFYQKKFPENKITGKYNLILCLDVLEHIKYDKLAVKKINKLLLICCYGSTRYGCFKCHVHRTKFNLLRTEVHIRFEYFIPGN